MHRSVGVAVLVALFVGLVGCGDGEGGDPPGRWGAGGTGGSANLPKGKGLELSTGLGLTVVPEPLPGESNLHGSVLVSRDGDPTEDHVAAVNGEALHTAFGLATPVDGVTYPGVGTGADLRIEVSEGEDTVEVTAPCPGDIELLTPSEGAAVGAGDVVEVSWAGDPYAAESPFFPVLSIRAADAHGRLELLPASVQIGEGTTRAELRAPAEAVEREAYLVMTIPGRLIEEENGAGGRHEAACTLQLRRRIEVVAP